VFQDRFSNFNLRKPVSRFTAAIANLKKRIPNQNPEMQGPKSLSGHPKAANDGHLKTGQR
jgi:hypothetical protein